MFGTFQVTPRLTFMRRVHVHYIRVHRRPIKANRRSNKMIRQVEDTWHAPLNRDSKIAPTVDCAVRTADNIRDDVSYQKSCHIPIWKGDCTASAKNAVVGENGDNLRAIEAFPHDDSVGVVVNHSTLVGYIVVGGFDSLCTEDVKGGGESIE